MPAVGPGGEVYVSWPGPQGIVFDRSTDGGETWLSEDILVAANPAGDHYHISGVSRGGSVPTIACDLSDGPHRGNIYINWSGMIDESSHTDVWLSTSTDGGFTWSEPGLVNDDASGRDQFFHWIAVDPTNGVLYCVFYDRRHYDDDRTDVFLAVSRDGGATFTNHRISESPFIPSGMKFMGDYSHIAAIGETIRPVWARMDDGEVSVWTAIIDPDQLTSVPHRRVDRVPVPDRLMIRAVYPNPFNESTTIHYHLPRGGDVTIAVYDLLGKQIETVFSGDQPGGEYRIIWTAAAQPSGVYLIRLELDAMVSEKRIVLTK
jgi:hypothetical protein